MFNNTSNTHKRKREDSINSFIIDQYETPTNKVTIPTQLFPESLKIYKYYAGKYIYQLYLFKDVIESTYNVTLTYEIDEYITIYYTKIDDLNYVMDDIIDLKNNIVLDKSKIFKAKILVENYNIIEEYQYILDTIRNYMIAPSVSYELLCDKIKLKGPKKQLIKFFDEYNSLVNTDFPNLNEVNPTIYKKYKR